MLSTSPRAASAVRAACGPPDRRAAGPLALDLGRVLRVAHHGDEVEPEIVDSVAEPHLLLRACYHELALEDVVDDLGGTVVVVALLLCCGEDARGGWQ